MDNTEIYLRFYADNKPYYINRMFSFAVKKADEDTTYLQAEIKARKILQHFWDNSNTIRAAFLILDGVSNRFSDQEIIKEKDGKKYIDYVFYWERYSKFNNSS